MKKTANGFTVIELIFAATIFAIASIFFFVQKDDLQIAAVNDSKKAAINAMYYGLEEVFYPENGYYPQSISIENLKSVDPILFTDPGGEEINTADGAYSYKPTDCDGNKCKGYTLKTTLENEDDYIKTNKN